MTTGLETLDADRRGRMSHVEVCRVAESRGTQSCDLRSFDTAGLLLSLDHFHFQGPFSEAERRTGFCGHD